MSQWSMSEEDEDGVVDELETGAVFEAETELVPVVFAADIAI